MVSWLQQYLQLGGLEVLLNLLNSLEVKPKYGITVIFPSILYKNWILIRFNFRKTTKDLYVIYECVQCIKAVMNNDAGK